MAVIGPGAMGLLFSAYLKEGGLKVVLLDHRPERAAQLTEEGILVEGVRGERLVKVPVTCDASGAGPVDLIIVWVKAYSTEAAMKMHRAAVGPRTVIFSAQNGIGNLDTIGKIAGPDRVLGGITTIGAHLLAQGRVRHAAEGDTWLGEPGGGMSERAADICRRLSQAGIPVRPSENIHRAIWEKLAVNAAINPLTALLRVPNGKLLEIESARSLMDRLVEEVARVAAGQGVKLDPAALQKRAAQVAQATARNRSSMLQDVEAGRRTEIGFINGAVAALGEAPLNRVLTELIEAKEQWRKISSLREREPMLFRILDNIVDPLEKKTDGT